MIATLALVPLLQIAAPLSALPPQDWATLPVLRYSRTPVDRAELATFVRTEVRNGRCTAARATSTGWSLSVDIALLVSPTGTVRRTLPRAIGCPAVEQYAAGLAFSRAMKNVVLDGMTTDSWYRTTMTFAWSA